ncbi:hypothetical protein ABT095_13395 [Kitasatospora sp. NPDC002227]|uniref:hypothetical protein n=1 Tax=Kitasatospora sp. NPDC002227 TaxID=3154773 RepID=UPI00332CB3D9
MGGMFSRHACTNPSADDAARSADTQRARAAQEEANQRWWNGQETSASPPTGKPSSLVKGCCLSLAVVAVLAVLAVVGWVLMGGHH